MEQLAIAGALARLSEADQELIRLIAWEGLSPAQAAEALGCRPSALTTRLNRARNRLRTAIAAAEAPPATNPRTSTPRSPLP